MSDWADELAGELSDCFTYNPTFRTDDLDYAAVAKLIRERCAPLSERGCHYCHGLLDAKKGGAGLYECRACAARWPND